MTRAPGALRGLVRAVFGPLGDRQSYKHIAYVLLAVPLGFFYSLVFGFGLTVGIVLSIVVVGLVVLAGMLGVARLAMGFERRLANQLLAVEITPPDDVENGAGLTGTLQAYLDATSTWRGLGFLMLKFWLLIVAVAVLVGFSTAGSMIWALIDRPRTVEFGEVNGEPVVWAIETLPEAVLAAGLGGLLAVGVVHVTNLFGGIAGRMAEALLR